MVDNRFFVPDPCPGVKKYLEVTYNCVVEGKNVFVLDGAFIPRLSDGVVLCPYRLGRSDDRYSAAPPDN